MLVYLLWHEMLIQVGHDAKNPSNDSNDSISILARFNKKIK